MPVSVLCSDVCMVEHETSVPNYARGVLWLSQTLSFFSFTLPQIVGSVYALMREGFELYKHRQHVDPLALAHPILIGTRQSTLCNSTNTLIRNDICATGIVRKLMGYFKYHFIEKKQRDVIQKTRNKMSRLVANALDGLADIQVNNLQKHQLHLLDQMIRTELANSLGFKTLVARTWQLFSNRNALEFVAEVYVVHQVIARLPNMSSNQFPCSLLMPLFSLGTAEGDATTTNQP